jgi:hypothetical protein
MGFEEGTKDHVPLVASTIFNIMDIPSIPTASAYY